MGGSGGFYGSSAVVATSTLGGTDGFAAACGGGFTIAAAGVPAVLPSASYSASAPRATQLQLAPRDGTQIQLGSRGPGRPMRISNIDGLEPAQTLL